jgi:hypothetical protein
MIQENQSVVNVVRSVVGGDALGAQEKRIQIPGPSQRCEGRAMNIRLTRNTGISKDNVYKIRTGIDTRSIAT